MWESSTVPISSPYHSSIELFQEPKVGGKCLCLPLRYGVMVIGVLGCIVNVSGMVAYGIVQVPSIRESITDVFSLGMDLSLLQFDGASYSDRYKNTQLVYTLEIAGVLSGMTLGVLVNILLIFGIIKWKRWYLLHWMIYHLALLVILFVVSVTVFSVEMSLRKLLGVVPALASFFFIYCWIKVYELFCYLSLVSGYGLETSHYCDLHPPLPAAPYCVPVNIHHNTNDKEVLEDDEGAGGEDLVVLGTEFYPVDPLSRGMLDRLVILNRSMTGNTYIPFHEDTEYTASQKSDDNNEDIVQPNDLSHNHNSAKYKSNLTVEI